MSLLSQLKKVVENLPEGLGKPLARAPFSLRLGPAYARFSRIVTNAEPCSSIVTSQRLLDSLQEIASSAWQHSTFYRGFYHARGFSVPTSLSFGDWQNVPIVTKADLQPIPLEERCLAGKRGMRVNTGGTSGQPLEFFLDRQAFAREWAHMHFIWKARGYSPQHLKLTFRGKHFESGTAIRYNAVHNEYVVNANVPMSRVVEAVLALRSSTVIRWLHGYPSLIAEFAHAVSGLAPQELERIRGPLFGAMLGSEYPAPVYRDVIERVLTTNVVSWYGHSEMAVLAREIARGVYQSLPTYGYAEAVPTEDGSAYRLVCTSLHNRVHPFIRYDTGDLIEPICQDGGVLTFRIAEGRVGDFIEDLNGNRHSLTAVIFGRHHQIFSELQHLQVRQESPGVVTLVVTPKDRSINEVEIRQGFDLDDLPIQWQVEIVSEPVRTSAGKIRLKIS